MKLIKAPFLLPALIVGVCLFAPTVGYSKDHDHHHDDHHDHGHHHGSYRYYPYYYGSGYYYSRPSVGISITSRPSYYRGSSYSDDLAVDVQRALARRGYYRGPIDGDIGPGSRSAIRAYQYDRGLAATGRIDQSLLRSLRLG
jgi:hypothetical protein